MKNRVLSDPLPPSAALPLCKGENAIVPLTKGDGREAAGGRSHPGFSFRQSREVGLLQEEFLERADRRAP